MESVTCSICESQVSSDEVFCPVCARPLVAATAVEMPVAPAADEDAEREAAPLTGGAGLCSTPGCGQPLEEGSAVCVYCGEPVATARAAEARTLVFPWASHTLAEGESTVLGRAHPPFAEPLADYPNVGRTHAQATLLGGALVLTDLGSTNGTFVDGRRIPPNVPTELRVGQVLRLAANLEIEIR